MDLMSSAITSVPLLPTHSKRIKGAQTRQHLPPQHSPQAAAAERRVATAVRRAAPPLSRHGLIALRSRSETEPHRSGTVRERSRLALGRLC